MNRTAPVSLVRIPASTSGWGNSSNEAFASPVASTRNVARPFRSRAHHLYPTLRFSPVADHDILEFIMQELLSCLFELRINFQEIRKHANRAQILCAFLVRPP